MAKPGMPQPSDDAIHISGAGPAGLAAAITIARAGGKAIVHERKSDVGLRFHGDFQGIENWTTEGDVLEELSAIGIKPDFEHTPFHEVVCYDPAGLEYVYRSAQPLFYLVCRGNQLGTLDASLKKQAQAAGAELRFDDAMHRMPHGGIVSEGPHGADVIAAGYVFETDMADGVYTALSDRLAPEGYAYLLIHNGQGTLATCMFDDFHNELIYLKRTVGFFEKKTGVQIKNPKRFGGVGNFFSSARAHKGNILYVGESAGFQDALWGFGMRHAVLSGHLGAKAMLTGNTYERLWKNRLGGLLRASLVNRFFFSKMGDRGYTAFLKRISQVDDAREWLHGHYEPSLWKNLGFPIIRFFRHSRLRGRICLREGCDCTWCRCRHACSEEAG